MITINYLNLEGGIIVFFPRGYNSEDGDLHPPQIAYNKPLTNTKLLRNRFV